LDDNLPNVLAAKRLGWGSCVWFNETNAEAVEGGRRIEREDVSAASLGIDAVIGNLEQLRDIWSDIFLR
jgi:pyrimidine and pyridine-specific 5'-nucleotidase